MRLLRAHADTLKQQDQIGPDYRRLTATWVMVFMILCWGKLSIWFGVDVLTALVPLSLGFMVLACLSPPVATALYFLGNYFLGNLSIAYYPRMSFLTVIAAVLLGTLLVVRWRRGELARFLALPKRVWLAVAALALFFLLGFARAMWEVHTLVSAPGDSNSMTAALKESLSGGMRGSSLLSHYMFLSHWLVFLTIGALTCLSRDDLRTFFLSFSLLFVVQLLAIPFSYYPEYFQAIYRKCEPLGLGYAQVNRGNLGYMAALASGFALTLAHDRENSRRILLLTWWLVLSSFVFLSASKGPVLAWLVATAYVLWRGRRLETLPYRMLPAALGVLVSVGLLSAAAGYSIVPCGMVKKLGEARHSAEVRIAMVRDRLASYSPLKACETVYLSDGKPVHLSAEGAILYRIVEKENIDSPNRYMPLADLVADMLHRADGSAKSGPCPDGDVSMKAGVPRLSLVTWLLGNGFGGSNRSIDRGNKSFVTHAGSLNLFIDLFIETGAVGLLLLAFAVMALWRHFRNSVFSEVPADGRLLVMGLSAMALVVLVKINVAAETSAEDLAALMVGLLVGAAAMSARNHRDSQPSRAQGGA